MEDVSSWFAQPLTGTVETAAAPWWRLVPNGTRTVVVRRPVVDVVDSLTRLGMAFDVPSVTRSLCRLDSKLDQIERRVPDALSVRFSDLMDEQVCAAVFEHCLPYRHDSAWFSSMAPLNLQIDFPAMLRHWASHEPQIMRLAKVAKHKSLAKMARSPQAAIDGITFQREPFREFYKDAGHLFSEHLVQTGQSPDDYASKNIPFFQVLDDLGVLHVFTSRSNGRMFSYLVSVISPSLDSPNETLAEQTIFFADPSYPGLGMKTQRAAIADLKDMGIDRVLMRAGHRGSGPRLGAIFRRLGAEPFGSLYNLPLKDAA
jgi:hypothetical protein